jgi:predicted acetyltransferase
MQLIAPSLFFEAEFSAFCDDYIHNDPENGEYYLDGKTNFSHYVQRLMDEERGVNLKEGYVPCSHYWLVNSDKSIVGAIRVRHNIDSEFLSLEAGHIGYDIAPSFRRLGHGKTMLKLALAKAKALGLFRVLVTADEDNIASRKIIEASDGELENIVMGKVFPNLLARYWIYC